MLCAWYIGLQLLVGQVCYRFCRCCEQGRGLHPYHGDDQRETNEGIVAWGSREHDSERGDNVWSDPNYVEPIRNVDLGEVHWAQSGVSSRYQLQNPPQGLAKLHGFRGREGGCIQIHREERVVAYCPGTADPLGDHAHRAEVQVLFI
jgi:hypothetical protein